MTTLFLFDFDGTLARTLPAICESYRYAFRRVLGRDFPAGESDLQRVLTSRFSDLCAEEGESAPLLIEAFRERYLGDLEEPVTLYDGVLETLRGLVDGDLAVGIVTNKTRLALEADLARTGLEEIPFAAIVTAEDTVEAKPHPRPLEVGRRRCGITADVVYYVGDSLNDMRAAKAAGMRGVAVAWGDFEREALLEERPFALVDHPTELPGLLAPARATTITTTS